MAGIGLDDGRARLALDSVRERLATPHGIVVLQPAFTRYHLHLGEISTYPGGYKENAGVFCHTNPWVMIAETMVGDGDAAIDYYLRINPSAREEISEIHRGEPYVYAQMIAGQGRGDPRRGQEHLADRDRRLELHGDQPVDPRHPTRARRPPDRPLRSHGLGRLHGHAPVPGRDLPDHRPHVAGRAGPRDTAAGRRSGGRRQPRPAARHPRGGDRGRGVRRDGAVTVGPLPRASPYGRLDPATREYVICRPDTPTPWLNYLGQGGYGGIISNTAGGFSFDRDPRERRVTRYRYNAIPADQPGRYVYLRDQESGRFWSPSWQPVRRRPRRLRVPARARLHPHHGSARRHRGRAPVLRPAGQRRRFLPVRAVGGPRPQPELATTAPAELLVRRVRLRRRRERPAEPGLVAAHRHEPARRQRDPHHHPVPTDDHVPRGQRAPVQAGPAIATTSWVASGTSRRPPSWLQASRPMPAARAATRSARSPTTSSSTRATSGSSCSCSASPSDPEEIAAVVARYSRPDEVDRAFEELGEDWDAYLGRFTVTTPDPDTTAMLSVWNQVQCRTTLNWSRFVSGYETGLGRGMGTRDSAQDTLGTMHSLPEARAADPFPHVGPPVPRRPRVAPALSALRGGWARPCRRVPDLAAVVLRRPPVARAGNLCLPPGDRRPRLPRGSGSHGPTATTRRSGGTCSGRSSSRSGTGGRMAFRGSGSPTGTTRSTPTTARVRPRASGPGCCSAESRWTSPTWLATLGRPDDAARFRDLHAEMAALVNATAWDGAWYARAFDDNGRPIGVASEERHRINLNPQTWSVIGEVAPPVRAELALRSVEELLATPFGTALLWPPYDGGDERVRGTSTYPPGAKENGGIFCHANTWLDHRGGDARSRRRRVSSTTAASCRWPGPTPTATGPSPTSTPRTSAARPTRSSAWRATPG